MFDLDVTSVLLGLLVFLLTRTIFSKKYNLPPSPFSVPVLGNVFLLYKYGIHLYRAGPELSQKYGKLVTLRMGSVQLVLILDYRVMRDAYSREEFSGRLVPFIKREQMLWKNYGVIWSEGDLWVEQRRFALRHLKDFGFGRKSLEGIIIEEGQELVEELKSKSGRFTMERLIFNMSVFNILWTVVGGQRFNHDDPRLQKVMKKVSNSDSLSMVVLSFFPWVRYVLPDKWTGVNYIRKKVAVVHDLFEEMMKDHEETFQENEMRDFIDVFIRETRREQTTDSTFTNEQLKVLLYDLFIAGSETTTTTLYWCLLLMVKYPTVQEKVQQQLDEVVGQNRAPTMDDRNSLPYVEATILEVQRFSGAVPFPPIHRTTRDTKLNGYDIPKGVGVLANLHCILHDPEYWKDPDEFRPDRFLDASGKLVKDERMVPFGIGRRVCLGESLARIELFLLFAQILQQLNFRSPPGESPDIESISQFDQTAVIVPKPFRCEVIPR